MKVAIVLAPKRTFPLTCNNSVGLAVPIPKLPVIVEPVRRTALLELKKAALDVATILGNILLLAVKAVFDVAKRRG